MHAFARRGNECTDTSKSLCFITAWELLSHNLSSNNVMHTVPSIGYNYTHCDGGRPLDSLNHSAGSVAAYKRPTAFFYGLILPGVMYRYLYHVHHPLKCVKYFQQCSVLHASQCKNRMSFNVKC